MTPAPAGCVLPPSGSCRPATAAAPTAFSSISGQTARSTRWSLTRCVSRGRAAWGTWLRAAKKVALPAAPLPPPTEPPCCAMKRGIACQRSRPACVSCTTHCGAAGGVEPAVAAPAASASVANTSLIKTCASAAGGTSAVPPWPCATAAKTRRGVPASSIPPAAALAASSAGDPPSEVASGSSTYTSMRVTWRKNSSDCAATARYSSHSASSEAASPGTGLISDAAAVVAVRSGSRNSVPENGVAMSQPKKHNGSSWCGKRASSPRGSMRPPPMPPSCSCGERGGGDEAVALPPCANLMRMPGCPTVAPGTYAACGSNMTRSPPLTSCGTSVRWYAAQKPSPKRPVASSRSSLDACPMRARLAKSRALNCASL